MAAFARSSAMRSNNQFQPFAIAEPKAAIAEPPEDLLERGIEAANRVRAVHPANTTDDP